MYEDKTLKCKECGAEFVFTAGEQEFYAAHSFANAPKLCKSCRAARNAAGNSTERPAREMFTATCSTCGGLARLPFKPRPDRRVYCSNCYARIKETNSLQVQ